MIRNAINDLRQLTIKELGQDGESKILNLPGDFFESDVFQNDPMLGRASRRQQRLLLQDWGTVFEEDQLSLLVPPQRLAFAVHHLQNLVWQHLGSQVEQHEGEILERMGFTPNLDLLDDGDDNKQFTLRLQNTVSIWFTINPTKWMRDKDKVSLANRAKSAKKLNGQTTLVFSRRLLNQDTFEELSRYGDENDINLIDFDQLPIDGLSREDRELVRLAHAELDNLQIGGNVAAASDLVRWLRPIISQGIYLDIDLEPDFTSFNGDDFRSRSPLLINMGSELKESSNIEDESIAMNTDMIGVVQEIDNPLTQQLMQAIKRDILARYHYGLRVCQWFPQFRELREMPGFLEIIGTGAEVTNLRSLFRLRHAVVEATKSREATEVFTGKKLELRESESEKQALDNLRKNLFRPLVTLISGPLAVTSAVLHGWPGHFTFDKRNQFSRRITQIYILQNNISFTAVGFGKIFKSDNIPGWRETQEALLRRQIAESDTTEGLSWIPGTESDQDDDDKRSPVRQDLRSRRIPVPTNIDRRLSLSGSGSGQALTQTMPTSSVGDRDSLRGRSPDRVAPPGPSPVPVQSSKPMQPGKKRGSSRTRRK